MDIAQVTVTFSGLQCTRNSSMRKHYERHIGIFSSSQKRLSLLHAQVNDKCPDSSHSPLKHNCSTKWIENYDVIFVLKVFVLFFQGFCYKVVFVFDRLEGVVQGWANYGPRAACSPREHSVRPANTF